MSLLSTQNSSALVQQLWQRPTLPGDPTTPSGADKADIVPSSIVDLANWLRVLTKTRLVDKNRPFVVVHRTEGSQTPPCEVSIRLQGFLMKPVLRSLGNWDGTSHNAWKAVQSLALAGNDSEPWLVTLAQLNNVIKVVTRMVAKANEDAVEHLFVEEPTTVIPFQRRVFTKSSSLRGDDKHPIPEDAGRHMDTIRKMSSQWGFGVPLVLGVLQGDIVRPCQHVVLAEGDFVDVVASLEVVLKRGLPRVHFLVDRVIQLCPALPPIPAQVATNDVEEVVLRRRVHDIFAKGPLPPAAQE
ncbi:hypothetical protein EXIGLDRAFT_780884 [Exidia glandulosa HHB12029]|uniref:Uncharacterized protein n=1 Tax=Exidia glandulosa HHB12029 TaxID=1314781 RepID=A0A165BF07_EXIGL|nr:hypothetical protein EXIGLDRAFT_780884 [Exidia glandulosa HHB12029]